MKGYLGKFFFSVAKCFAIISFLRVVSYWRREARGTDAFLRRLGDQGSCIDSLRCRSGIRCRSAVIRAKSNRQIGGGGDQDCIGQKGETHSGEYHSISWSNVCHRILFVSFLPALLVRPSWQLVCNSGTLRGPMARDHVNGRPLAIIFRFDVALPLLFLGTYPPTASTAFIWAASNKCGIHYISTKPNR